MLAFATWLLALSPLVACSYLQIPLIGLPERCRFISDSVICSSSNSSVLASISASTGTINWRHAFPELIQSFDVQNDVVLARFSNKLTVFSLSSGHLQSELVLDGLKGSRLTEKKAIGWTDKAIHSYTAGELTLASTYDAAHAVTAQRTGYVSSDQSGALLYHPFDGLSTTSLGKYLELVVYDDQLVWLTDSFSIKSYSPGSGITLYKDSVSSPFYAIQSLDTKKYLLAQRKDGTASVLKFSKSGLTSAWEFKDADAAAVYSSSVDLKGNTHIARLTYNVGMNMAFLSIYSDSPSPLNTNGQGYVTGSSFSYDQSKHGRIVSAVLQVAAPEDDADDRRKSTTVYRAMYVSTAGSCQMWYAGSKGLVWKREEGLAEIDSIAWTDESSPEARQVTTGQEGILQRWQRHFTSLATIDWLHFFNADAWKAKPTVELDQAWMATAFGYKKNAIVSSRHGKIYGLQVMDAVSTGDHVLWETLVEPNLALPAVIDWYKIWSVIQSDGEKQVIAVGTIVDGQEAITKFYRLDASNGKLLQSQTISKSKPIAILPISSLGLEASSHFVIIDNSNRAITVSLETGKSPALSSKPFYYHRQTSPKRVEGWQIHAQTNSLVKDVIDSLPLVDAAERSLGDNKLTWSLELPESSDEVIHSITAQNIDTVASIGRILGNRTTLYKFLSPHLIAVASTSSDSLTISLVDSISGSTIYRSKHLNVASPERLSVHLTENWLVYSFVDNELGESTRLVSVEVFEGTDRGKKVKGQPRPLPRTKIQSSFAQPNQTYIYSQSFIAPYGIKTLSSTTTRFGVSRKALIVTTDQDSIIAIPRRFLDPRRPIGKPSKYDQEEQLMPYEALIPNDPKWVVSQNSQYLTGKRPIISTTSTLLESTSLLLAGGLDLLSSSQLAPSGTFDVLSQDFNKGQLGLVMGGLLLMIGVVKPIVGSRKVNSRWTQVLQ